ncbi:efflux RND transporter permease subunit, partial [Agriterribacter sp.]|uniref:TolC family protein n=1 Tax=Agriterribacter sp. TaxID=2821509 RepID=UPI002BB50129
GGQFENLVEATQRLSVAVPVALLLILVMLYFAFGSLKYGLLIFSAIPLSAIGGILALWARDMPFSISAGVGFIALFGVAVLNGIVLIAEFNRLKQTGLQDIQQIIMEGTRIRLRPVLMTASVASLGFLPMALSQGAGAEVQRPLATVVIGGLITATMLTLVVLPVLYRWFEKRGMKKNRMKPAAALILSFLLCSAVQGQQKLTLDKMLKMGSKQNLNLQSVKKEADYWKQLQAGVFDPGKTQLGGEYGGINGVKNDTRFFVSQGFNLPVVYHRQRQLFKNEQTAQEQLANWKQADLQREIKKVFYALANGLERKKLLQRLDSVYSRFQQSAALRLEAGESNVLEKTTADAQLQQLQLQQQHLDADILIWQQQLQWLLNTDELFLPAYATLKMGDMALPDTTSVTAHPQIQYNKLLEQTAAAQTNVEKAKLLPDFAVGYSNQSIIGYHSEDGISQKYYSGSNRFHIASVTVGIPLFNSAAKARIKAGSVQEEVAEMNTKATMQYLKYNLQQLTETLKKEQNNLEYYENAGLQQSELIIKAARLSFENGEISYLEWTTLMNNAVNIRLNYMDAVHQYNQTLIELEYLTGK